ncbi:MAG: 50S ribosomal protein L11 methyltransferase [Flavobacteriaceae bacterium]|tara:strand:- start:2555 stop:3400 length:846 start_codon:yes stop_codon:yes gene_type:complete
MSSIYISINFIVKPVYPGVEILLAELSQLEFEMFEETDLGLVAYIEEHFFLEKKIFDLSIFNSKEFKISFTKKKIKNQNWNKRWESNFDAVEINSSCAVRAPFHEKSNKQFDIIIMPEMSFGTGHHETTQLMMKYILELNISEFMVCDIGCGTGILSILAEMKGAKKIDAVDISKNCCNNTLSNIKLNNCDKIFVHNSNSKILQGKLYDLILSNMTYDKLSKNFKNFSTLINEGGELIISGFFENDLGLINDELISYNFTFINSINKNKWVAARFAYNTAS